jgi:hypothetical protein
MHLSTYWFKTLFKSSAACSHYSIPNRMVLFQENLVSWYSLFKGGNHKLCRANRPQLPNVCTVCHFIDQHLDFVCSFNSTYVYSREEYRKEFQGNLYRVYPNQTVVDDSEFDQENSCCSGLSSYLSIKYLVLLIVKCMLINRIKSRNFTIFDIYLYLIVLWI